MEDAVLAGLDVSDTTHRYRFVCPGCSESIEVNSSMRATLLSEGCVVCGYEVSSRDFERLN